MYGRPGIGKSTFAAQALSPIFISLEDGLNQIDAAAIEPTPRTWADVIAALEYAGTLDHETVAIDSLDHLEPMCWEHTVKEAKSAKIKSIEDFGYGKGYIAALDHWRVFVKQLDLLRARGMNVIMIAHAARKVFKNPLGDDFEHWTIKLHEKTTGLLVEKSDVVAFCDDDIAIEDTSGRAKAQTTGKRIIRTDSHPAYLAKTRFQIPAVLPLSWKAFAAAVRDGDEAKVIELRTGLEERIKRLGDVETEEKVRAFVKERGETATTLTKAIERLDETLAKKAG